ncbi:MAG TPA: hypothetical protein VK203_31095 [Nostocaceae cyanobacterium]|nr:hypothetical protein [Nostocaceae cyanobacterium]
MYTTAQGIPGLPDLTHPQELLKFGSQLLKGSLLIVFLVIALGVAIALISFSLRRHTTEQAVFFGEWSIRYSQLLKGLQHLALILILVISGFFLCSTLSNRYHHWEQAKVAQVAESVAGERLEQPAPRIRYVTTESYSYNTQVNGKIVKVNDQQKVSRYLTLAGSQIQANIDQSIDVQGRGSIYIVDYTAEYKVVNTLRDINSFFFEATPPNGYVLLDGYKVEREGTRLQQINPGDYGFPFKLEPGAETTFKVTYKAQGAPRWIYNASSDLLSKFQLTATANFSPADFASGIIPKEIKSEGNKTIFVWKFEENVAVRNPFGVFTSTSPIKNTGIIPRLLLLAPALFLWWILLLYLSIPMNLKNVAIAGGVFFACLLSLTYISRVINPQISWTVIAFFLLGLSWGLGGNRRASLAAIICTISGAIIPVFALLVPYSGLTLSIAGLLSTMWLAIRHWYSWYQLPTEN